MGDKWTAELYYTAPDTLLLYSGADAFNPVAIIKEATILKAEEHHVNLCVSVHRGFCGLLKTRIH